MTSGRRRVERSTWRRSRAVLAAALIALAACGADGAEPAGDPTGTVDPPADTRPSGRVVADPMDGGTVIPPPTEGGDPPAPPAPTASTLPPPAVDVEVPPPGGVPEQAQADLASRLAVPVDAVAVVGVEEVTWRDGSLGCPEPGGVYTQALVDGLRIVLAAGGSTYAYHSDADGPPFHCADPAEAGTATAGGGRDR